MNAATVPARGLFISLEGLEGVGKTSNRSVVQSVLTASGREVLCTREPGGTPLGETLRNLVLEDGGMMQAETELLLMTASRVEHVATVIAPALAAGRAVVCDRFLDASVAYQGGGRELGVDTVVRLHTEVGVTLRPDLTLLYDMPVEAGMARMAARGKPDRIEQESLDFFARARAAYLQRASDEADRIVIIDAARPLEEVQKSTADAVGQLLSTR